MWFYINNKVKGCHADATGDACTSVPVVTIIFSLLHAAFVVVKIAP